MPEVAAATTPDAPPPIPCPDIVRDKVRQFAEQIETYVQGDYSEAQLRIDFINPLLDALGWDVNNRQGHAEAYREVVYEDALKVAGTSKAPDYGFYIGGRAAGGGRKFFLEAKRPSVPIRVDPKPGFQLRRYAYSAELPLSILTNFKEFIVYDTRFKPGPRDSATAAAILTLKFTEFPARWHEIASIFSRDAILRGAFDKFAQSKRKKGMEPLGESFLKDIEEWRALLAREVATSNPDITVDDLNFAVQRTIDRILFLRICEDRGIEPVHNLLGVTNGENVYARLGQIFRGADDRYNSGIFHFPAAGKKPDPDRTEPPDDLTLDLTIDDKPLRKIICDLYDLPGLFASYEFAVIPPEILGQVYERFLGRVITLTKEHRVRIEEKPEVRKAGGVYYTPAYIVDYIIRNTVGKLLGDPPLAPGSAGGSSSKNAPQHHPPAEPGANGGVTPVDAAQIRIVDPASGSGSFLIGAYQYLLDWHLRWYLANDPDEHCKGKNPPLTRITSPSLVEVEESPGRRGTSVRSVEPGAGSPQATRRGEVGEAREKDGGSSRTTHSTHPLTPSLKGRGKGRHDYRLTTPKRKEILLNSIYGVDIDPQAVEVTKLSLLLKVLEGESQESINAQLKFLHKRALPDLGRNIKCGNSLIGDDFDDSDLAEEERKRINKFNWQKEFPQIFKAGGFDAVIGNPPWGGNIDMALEYFHKRYPRSTQDHTDSFKLFIDRATTLVRGKGLVALIVPNTIMRQRRLKDIRQILVSGCLISVADLGEDVFTKVVAPSCVFVFQHDRVADGHIVQLLNLSRFDEQDRIAALVSAKPVVTLIRQETILQNTELAFTISTKGRAANLTRLGDLNELELKDAGINYQRVKVGMQAKGNSDLASRLLYEGKQKRSKDKMYWKGTDIDRYQIADSTNRFCRPDFHEFIRKNEVVRLNSRVYEFAPKILIRQTADRPIATIDQRGVWFGRSIIALLPTQRCKVDLKYGLGLLNSRYLQWVYEQLVQEAGRVFAQVKLSKLAQLPIRTIDFSNKSEKAKHDKMVKLVERMLDLHKKAAAAKSPHEKERLQREIESTDGQIDALVYELYGLTEEEIAIVEDAMKGKEKSKE